MRPHGSALAHRDRSSTSPPASVACDGCRAAGARCRIFERSAAWQPIAVRLIEQPADADWMIIGDGSAPVEVGLFLLKR